MVKKGLVVATDGRIATVEELNDTYCSECVNSGKSNNCLTCKNRAQTVAERHLCSNIIDAEIGDVVAYSKNKMANVVLSLITFILPVILMIVTYVVSNMISSNDQLSGRAALAVLAFSMIGAAGYSYKFSKNRCEYKIISKE